MQGGIRAFDFKLLIFPLCLGGRRRYCRFIAAAQQRGGGEQAEKNFHGGNYFWNQRIWPPITLGLNSRFVRSTPPTGLMNSTVALAVHCMKLSAEVSARRYRSEERRVGKECRYR